VSDIQCGRVASKFVAVHWSAVHWSAGVKEGGSAVEASREAGRV
jgi:hypothetical protein